MKTKKNNTIEISHLDCGRKAIWPTYSFISILKLPIRRDIIVSSPFYWNHFELCGYFVLIVERIEYLGSLATRRSVNVEVTFFRGCEFNAYLIFHSFLCLSPIGYAIHFPFINLNIVGIDPMQKSDSTYGCEMMMMLMMWCAILVFFGGGEELMVVWTCVHVFYLVLRCALRISIWIYGLHQQQNYWHIDKVESRQ